MRAPCAYIVTNTQRKACVLLQVDGEDTEVFKVSKAQVAALKQAQAFDLEVTNHTPCDLV